MISLDALPADIQYNILSWLICPLVGYDIQRAPQSARELSKADLHNLKGPIWADGKILGNHPYLCLAGVSTNLRAQVEDYCHHLVNVRMTIKAKRILAPEYTNWSADVAKATAKGKPSNRLRTYRLQYLKWSHECCLFCGKTSKRRAVFNLHMWCCKGCDDKNWGAKISKSEAKRQFRLQETHFTFPHLLWPEHYASGLDIAYANLPVYQGALMLKSADLAKLSEILKQNKPSTKQIRDINARATNATYDVRRLQCLDGDRKVMDDLKKLIENFKDGNLEIPASGHTVYRLSSAVRTCMHRLYAEAPHINDLARLRRVIKWLLHIAPDYLADSFRVTKDTLKSGVVRHQLKVLAKSPFEPDEGPTDENGKYWGGLITLDEHSSGLIQQGPNAYEVDRQQARVKQVGAKPQQVGVIFGYCLPD